MLGGVTILHIQNLPKKQTYVFVINIGSFAMCKTNETGSYGNKLKHWKVEEKFNLFPMRVSDIMIYLKETFGTLYMS